MNQLITKNTLLRTLAYAGSTRFVLSCRFGLSERGTLACIVYRSNFRSRLYQSFVWLVYSLGVALSTLDSAVGDERLVDSCNEMCIE
jgi:hypothetical protein